VVVGVGFVGAVMAAVVAASNAAVTRQPMSSWSVALMLPSEIVTSKHPPVVPVVIQPSPRVAPTPSARMISTPSLLVVASASRFKPVLVSTHERVPFAPSS
jgi:hypothetical protein